MRKVSWELNSFFFCKNDHLVPENISEEMIEEAFKFFEGERPDVENIMSVFNINFEAAKLAIISIERHTVINYVMNQEKRKEICEISGLSESDLDKIPLYKDHAIEVGAKFYKQRWELGLSKKAITKLCKCNTIYFTKNDDCLLCCYSREADAKLNKIEMEYLREMP